VAWLEQHFRTGTRGHEPHGDATLAALALHADAAADAALGRMVDAGQPVEQRRAATFWLAAARGRRGYEAIQGLLRDADSSLREHLTFALHVSGEPGAVGDLIGIAKRDPATGVRRQALFWLAQRAGDAAVSTLKAAIDHDPDGEVRQHAVFAVSQLPADRSVPLLIELSRTIAARRCAARRSSGWDSRTMLARWPTSKRSSAGTDLDKSALPPHCARML
jgi:HEAT repeat protein